ELFAIVQDVPPAAVSIMEKFWPGHVTLVFKASDHLPDNLMAGTRKIGVRVPVHPVGRALVKKLGTPLTGTSANLSGKPGCSLVSEIGPAITDHVDFVLDAGLLKGGTGSTVVDVTGETPTVLREGEIAAQDIFAAVKKPAQT
ncbi:MAG: L-threonylcarbamoyladenylate synthase, partial [Deltaproteobacteria bacterium]|nr:L-threonylcarbamoyladenylate synthase [Deltaproteobacteria bacterium]